MIKALAVVAVLVGLAGCSTFGISGSSRVVVNPDGSGTLITGGGTSSTVELVFPPGWLFGQGRTPASSGKIKTIEK